MSPKIIVFILTAIIAVVLSSFIFKKVKTSEINEKKGNDDFKENIYRKRMSWLLGYLIFSIFLFCAWFVIRSIKTNQLEKMLFCLSSNFLGAFICGFQWRTRSKANPLPAYLGYYPIVIVGFSALTFSLTKIIVSISKVSQDAVFYSMAFFIGIYCGQHIDNIKELGSIVKKLKTN